MNWPIGGFTSANRSLMLTIRPPYAMFTDTRIATAVVRYPASSRPTRDRTLTAAGPWTLFHSASTAKVARIAATLVQYCRAGSVSSMPPPPWSRRRTGQSLGEPGERGGEHLLPGALVVAAAERGDEGLHVRPLGEGVRPRGGDHLGGFRGRVDGVLGAGGHQQADGRAPGVRDQPERAVGVVEPGVVRQFLRVGHVVPGQRHGRAVAVRVLQDELRRAETAGRIAHQAPRVGRWFGPEVVDDHGADVVGQPCVHVGIAGDVAALLIVPRPGVSGDRRHLG